MSIFKRRVFIKGFCALVCDKYHDTFWYNVLWREYLKVRIYTSINGNTHLSLIPWL